MKHLIPVQDRNLARDPKSGALVATDRNKYLQAQARKQNAKRQAMLEKRVAMLERKVALLEQSLSSSAKPAETPRKKKSSKTKK